MDILYVPWRNEYVTQSRSTQPDTVEKDCVFCQQLEQGTDAQHFIIHRFGHCYVLLAKYPYNAGHVLILPIRHVAAFEQLSVAERHEISDVTVFCIDGLKQALSPNGFNVGVNLTRIAGAGIPGHLHQHVVPRFEGDTNFLPIIAQTKTISVDMHQIYRALKAYFEKIV